MFHIAICDDEVILCTQLEKYLEEYIERGIVSTEVFYSADKLYEMLNKGECYDLIFLDIEFQFTNSVEIGRKIRNELEENKFTAPDKEELQNLVINTDMGFEDEGVNESNCSYYILYTVNAQNEVIGLAGIKLAMTMNGIKTTQTHAYREADCVFELYCDSDIQLDSYKIRVKVPKKKTSVIIEEGEKADDNKGDSGVFSYQEMAQDLTGEEKASFGITSLKLSDKSRCFMPGKKQLENSIFVSE